MEPKKHINKRERVIGFIYVTFIFVLTCGLSLYFLFRHNQELLTIPEKALVIKKMERIHQFQDIQTYQATICDSVFTKIKRYNPGINASYEENDIKFLINDIKVRYSDNIWDNRYKAFLHVSDLYEMLLTDKKKTWSIGQNINNFRQNLQECEIGLEQKNQELNKIRQ